MKIVGISGSHRRGNTDFAVKRALSVCEKNGIKTEFISLADLRIEYCDDCGGCVKGRCPKGDDVEKILNAMASADAIIVGSPTYFACVSGKLKALLDRTLPLRRQGFKLAGKIGGAIAIGGSRNGGQEFTTMAIRNWMLVQNMVVVSDMKTAHFGGIAVGRTPDDIKNDKTGLETIDNLALTICELLSRKR